MYYLIFALFFGGYVLVGWFTDMLQLSTPAIVISIAMFFANIYMFFRARARKRAEEQTESE